MGVVLGNGRYVNFAVDPVMKRGWNPIGKASLPEGCTIFFSRTASAGTRSCPGGADHGGWSYGNSGGQQQSPGKAGEVL